MTDFKETEFGHVLQTQKYEVFFGSSKTNLDDIKKLYPYYQICSLHQVHGNHCVEGNNGPERKADAHFSYDKHKALVIKTADCVPLMCYCPTTDTVLAIHAGWRGLENKIIPKSIEQAFPYSKKSNIEVFVGPHIARDNYEFQREDIEKFSEYKNIPYYLEKNEKFYFDVSAILYKQLNDIGIQEGRIHDVNIDTFTSPHHHSHRKGCDGKRLYHFIVRK